MIILETAAKPGLAFAPGEGPWQWGVLSQLKTSGLNFGLKFINAALNNRFE